MSVRQTLSSRGVLYSPRRLLYTGMQLTGSCVNKDRSACPATGAPRGPGLLYSPNCLELEFSEVELRIDGALRSSAIIQKQGVGVGPSQVLPFCLLRLGVYS